MDYKTDEKTSWETVRLNIMDKEAFLAVTEDQAIKFFKYSYNGHVWCLVLCFTSSRDFQRDLSETCQHNHGKKKSKKSKKKKKVSSSSSESEMVERRSRKKRDSDTTDTDESEEERSRKKKKKEKEKQGSSQITIREQESYI